MSPNPGRATKAIGGARAPIRISARFGFCQETTMDTTTLLIILIVLLVLGGGGYYGRGRWY